MPGIDRRIDPVTKDYIDDGVGGYENTTTVETAGYHQIQTQIDRWWADPTKGSGVYLVPQMTLSEATIQFLEDTIRAAFQALIDAGLAREQRVEVANSELVVDRLLLLAELVDAAATQVDLTEVGGI